MSQNGCQILILDTMISYSSPDNSLQSQKRELGGRLNKKDGLTRYGDSHVKDKTS